MTIVVVGEGGAPSRRLTPPASVDRARAPDAGRRDASADWHGAARRKRDFSVCMALLRLKQSLWKQADNAIIAVGTPESPLALFTADEDLALRQLF